MTVLVRVSLLVAAECVRMLAAVDADPLQRLLGKADGRLLDVGMTARGSGSATAAPKSSIDSSGCSSASA